MAKAWTVVAGVAGLMLAAGAAAGGPAEAPPQPWMQGVVTGDWELVSSDANMAVYYRADNPPREHFGWERVEYRSAQQVGGRTALSMTSQVEFDCAHNRMAILRVAIFPQHNLAGQATAAVMPDVRWDPIDPGSNGDYVSQRGCRGGGQGAF